MEIVYWIVIWSIVGGAITPLIYSSRNQSPVAGFFAGVISGALGGIFVLGPLWFFTLYAAEKTKICPKCAEQIKQQASVCRYCGHVFIEENNFSRNSDENDNIIFEEFQTVHSKQDVFSWIKQISQEDVKNIN